MTTPSSEQPAVATIDLKDPVLAGFLAWLIPGLGHWYQGRRAKAALYFICIVGLFAYGVYLSSSNEKCNNGVGTIGYGRAVYFSWRDGDWRLHYLGQIGVGLPATPAIVQAIRMNNHRKVWFNGLMAPPWVSEYARDNARFAAQRAGSGDQDDPNYNQPTAGELNRQLGRYFELGGFFTVVAGLLNVLAIYDACAGPVASQPATKKEEEPTEPPPA